MVLNDGKLIRIGVFYDGNYFLHVSNYYNFSHPRRSRVSISGLHEFLRHHTAQLESVDPRYVQVVDAHYFRGRLPAQEAKNRNKLLSERLFEDILMKEGVITHYLPLSHRGEKGIDVWLALEAFEMAVLKQYNVLVLIACDSDFVPLVRKLNAMGIRVMVLGWDFEYTDEFGNKRVTVTSSSLLHEVSYPVKMADIIDDRSKRNPSWMDSLFVPRDFHDYDPNANGGTVPAYGNGMMGPSSAPALPMGSPTAPAVTAKPALSPSDKAVSAGGSAERLQGRVQNVKEGYGFIETGIQGRNLFFYWEDVDGEFNDLGPGDLVEYSLGYNHRGECAVDVQKIADRDPDDAPTPANNSNIASVASRYND